MLGFVTSFMGHFPPWFVFLLLEVGRLLFPLLPGEHWVPRQRQPDIWSPLAHRCNWFIIFYVFNSWLYTTWEVAWFLLSNWLEVVQPMELSVISLSLKININSMKLQEHRFSVVKLYPFDCKLGELQKRKYIYIYLKRHNNNYVLLSSHTFVEFKTLYVTFILFSLNMNSKYSYCIIVSKAVQQVCIVIAQLACFFS